MCSLLAVKWSRQAATAIAVWRVRFCRAPRRAGAGANGEMSGEEARARMALLGHHLLDFWVNICLCHSLIVEEAEDGGPPIYQARAPPWTLLTDH